MKEKIMRNELTEIETQVQTQICSPGLTKVGYISIPTTPVNLRATNTISGRVMKETRHVRR